MFATATRLAVLLVGRNPKWTEQSDYSGAPSVADAGVFLEDAPVTKVDVRLRENLKFRTGRVSVETVADSETYNIEVRGDTAAFGSDSDATEQEIVNGLVDAVNALRQDVRARGVDEDGDGNLDTVYLESNRTAIFVDSVSAGEDYTVTVNGVDHTVTADGGAPSADGILTGLDSALDTSSAPVKSYAEDTDDDGNVDTIFIVPVEAGSLDVSVSATGAGSLTIAAQGQESDNPHYGLPGSTGSAELSLDADAVQVDARYYTTYKGDSEVPGGWRLVAEYTSIGYRGLDEAVATAGKERGYIEIANSNEGTPREVSQGPATLED